jgi:hypothetical protein
MNVGKTTIRNNEIRNNAPVPYNRYMYKLDSYKQRVFSAIGNLSIHEQINQINFSVN